jgi:diguanylate cyclase (GGDEF)-like protein/PAS domain S-box-containing protein
MSDELFYKSLLDNLYDAVYFTDRNRRITYWNKSAEQLTGFKSSEVLGHRCADNILMHVDNEGNLLCKSNCPLAKTIQDGENREAQVFLHHADGHRVPIWVRVAPIRDEHGEIIGGVEIFTDNSPVLADLDRIAELEKEVYLDPLTGIGNRRYTESKLKINFREFETHGTNFGVIFADIDHFKKVNDTFGHHIGDQVLKIVATTLRNNLRPFDFIGRWGGEEFVVVLPNVEIKDLRGAAERLRVMVEHSSLYLEDKVVQVTISMGGAIVRDGDTLDTLVHRADEQMYISKQNGRNQINLCD